MPTTRDPILQPRIDPPRRVEPAEVRRRWPGAVEALTQWEQEGRLTVGSEGTLWFESERGAGVHVWAASQVHGMAWIPQGQFRPDTCNCGRTLTERGRCLGCGSWPSRCMCPKEVR